MTPMTLAEFAAAVRAVAAECADLTAARHLDALADRIEGQHTLKEI